MRNYVEFARRCYRRLKTIFAPHLHKPIQSASYECLGSEYGGWPVLKNSLNSDSCVYSFGVGTDITFDLSLISKYECFVKAFDPTPRCIEWIKLQRTPKNFLFFPIGLSNKTEMLRFSAPPNALHASYTVGRRNASTETVELPVQALDEIMKTQGDIEIDFLKLDIEGSEYDVLPDMIAKQILPKQLCVEFHHGMFGYTDTQTVAAVEALTKEGYKLYFVSETGREYGFFR